VPSLARRVERQALPALLGRTRQTLLDCCAHATGCGWLGEGPDEQDGQDEGQQRLRTLLFIL
jgi:hypothetical protein